MGNENAIVISVSMLPLTQVSFPPSRCLSREKMAEHAVDSSGARFTPLVALELASDTKEEAIVWLLSRIRDKQQNGGGRAVKPCEAVALTMTRLGSWGLERVGLHEWTRPCQALIFWCSSWALELETRRRRTQTCS